MASEKFQSHYEADLGIFILRKAITAVNLTNTVKSLPTISLNNFIWI